MLIGYRYITDSGSGLPGPIVQKRKLAAGGVSFVGLPKPVLDNAPSRKERDWLLSHQYSFRDDDILCVADASILADNKEDARWVLRQLRKKSGRLQVADEEPRGVQTKEDFDYWMSRIVMDKSSRMRTSGGKVGRPPKWSFQSMPDATQKTIATLYYGGSKAASADAVVNACKEHGAHPKLSYANLWGQLGPRDGSAQPDWIKKLLKE